MLAEKKSLRRFLAIYISSTILLLGSGIYFYYKVSLNAIVEKNILQVNKNIEIFIGNNIKKRAFRTGVTPEYGDKQFSIYKDRDYFKGNFFIKDLNFESEHFLRDGKLYVLKKDKKRWGELSVLSYVDISKQIEELKHRILIFSLVAISFIIFISFLLGNLFLKPMKDTIKSLENFIADATHEINTPISSIKINIELLKELYPEFKKIEELEKIESASFRISKVFRDLSYLKLNHKQKRELEKINLKEFIENRLRFFQTFIKNKNIQIQGELQSVTIRIDREDLTRLIDNLLSNAIKFSKPNTKIEITLNKEYFEVINDGEIKDTSTIADKFKRENSDEGGFGLGLYIVKKICSSYGFKLEIVSKNKKVYSKIKLTYH